eukprot:3754178-Rhodomonas_salina.1
MSKFQTHARVHSRNFQERKRFFLIPLPRRAGWSWNPCVVTIVEIALPLPLVRCRLLLLLAASDVCASFLRDRRGWVCRAAVRREVPAYQGPGLQAGIPSARCVPTYPHTTCTWIGINGMDWNQRSGPGRRFLVVLWNTR